MSLIETLLRPFQRKRKKKQRELRFVTYAAADQLIRESKGLWKVAPEEDSNHAFGMVYIEREVNSNDLP